MARNANLLLLAALVAGISILSPAGYCDVATLSPSQAVVLPDDGSGLTKVAVQFDFAGLRTGEGRQIDEARLDWKPSGISSNHDTFYAAYAAGVSWTVSTAASSGIGNIESNAEPAAEWEFTSEDYYRNGGGFVRFDLRELVSGWADGTIANYGVVITTDDVNRSSAIASLPGALLTVRYGFARSATN